MAMLLPVLAPIKKFVKEEVACQNNLRQWGLSVEPYFTNKHVMPGENRGSQNCPWNGTGYLHFGTVMGSGELKPEDGEIGQCPMGATMPNLDKIGQTGSGIVRISYFQRGIPQGAPLTNMDFDAKKTILMCDNHAEFWWVVYANGTVEKVKKTFVFDRTNTSHWNALDKP